MNGARRDESAGVAWMSAHQIRSDGPPDFGVSLSEALHQERFASTYSRLIMSQRIPVVQESCYGYTEFLERIRPKILHEIMSLMATIWG